MKKIVIYKDEWIDNPAFPDGRQSRVRTTLRAITPSGLFQGYYANGTLNDSEVRNLARYLEPSFTGYSIA